MDHEEFHTMINGRLGVCVDVLLNKNATYATENESLHNFKRAGQLQDCTPERALLGMWTKHLISLMDIIDRLPELPDDPTLSEKITDTINYSLFLEALIRDRMKKS